MIEILASGLGADPDTATLSAMKTAVQQETRVLVESTTLVENGKLIDSTVLTRTAAYINAYKILGLEQTGNGWKARVLCTVDEKKLISDFNPQAVALEAFSIDGPLLGLLAWQNQRRKLDRLRAIEENKLQQQLQLRILEKFVSDAHFRSNFYISLKNFNVSVDEQVAITVNLDTKLPKTTLNPNFFIAGETYAPIKARLLDKYGSSLYNADVSAWYPWNSAWFFVNLEPEILAKVHKVTISWL